MEQKNKKYIFAILGLVTFLGFLWDNIQGGIVLALYKINFNQYTFSENIIYLTVVCIVWATWAFVMFLLAKNKFKFNICEFKEKPDKRGIIISLIILLLITIIIMMNWRFQLKPIAELNKKMQDYGTLGIISFVLQYIYYVCEMALAVLTIAFGQEAGEQIFKNKKFPWGGLFLGFTWGLIHIISKGMMTGIVIAIYGILYGIAYLLLKKNVKYAYPMILLMFVL